MKVVSFVLWLGFLMGDVKVRRSLHLLSTKGRRDLLQGIRSEGPRPSDSFPLPAFPDYILGY